MSVSLLIASKTDPEQRTLVPVAAQKLFGASGLQVDFRRDRVGAPAGGSIRIRLGRLRPDTELIKRRAQAKSRTGEARRRGGASAASILDVAEHAALPHRWQGRILAECATSNCTDSFWASIPRGPSTASSST